MSNKTKTLIGNDARNALLRGMGQVYEPVAASIGAAGRNTVYRQFGSPKITNDGVTISRKINPEDPFEALGSDLIYEAAERTNIEAGDGTTTTTILAYELFKYGIKQISEGKNAMVLRRELEQERDNAVRELKTMSVPVENNLYQVALISVEDDVLARIASDAVSEAGKDGIVIVDEHEGVKVEKEIVSGYSFDKGFISPYMMTDTNKMICELENVSVIVTDRYMNLNKELFPVLDKLYENQVRNVLVICENMAGELLANVVANKMKGLMNIIVVKKPQTQEELEDIAILTSSNSLTKDKGSNNIDIQDVGFAKKIIVKENKTIIVGENSDKLSERIQHLRDAAEKELASFSVKERLAKLTTGITMIKVGAKTESERTYIKLKMDDAVASCRAALDEGVVCGAGKTLDLLSEKSNHPVIKHAFSQPRKRILLNAGIADDGLSYNVLTGSVVKDFFNEGIIDPAKVTRCCIENAISVAAIALTTECLIAELPKQSAQQYQDSH